MRGGWENRVGFTGKVELRFIHITIGTDVTFAENITIGKEANTEEEGPQDRALGHTSG